MNKKIIIPCAIGVVILIVIIFSSIGGSKILIDIPSQPVPASISDSIILKVYMENSGSMDAYMCPGSTLKDAVYDYVSDASKVAIRTDLFYINSNIIPFNGDLDNYIKNLTPQAFAHAGGNRANTDLRDIFKKVLKAHQSNTITVFVSDCILDIPQKATDFFGNCQISIKNTFNTALQQFPTLGVQIVKMMSTFDGYWYCGQNRENLSQVKRPYYIWIIGEKNILEKLNKDAPVDNIYNGITEYCAYVPKINIPYDMQVKTHMINHSGKISVQLLANLSGTLQNENVITNLAQYSISNPSSVDIESISPVTAAGTKYSHVINLTLTSPETLKRVDISFTYPYLASWVESSNDDTGTNVKSNLDKTTGIKYLITGVAEAYKNYTNCCHFCFDIKNK